jgi:hypothetical protein
MLYTDRWEVILNGALRLILNEVSVIYLNVLSFHFLERAIETTRNLSQGGRPPQKKAEILTSSSQHTFFLIKYVLWVLIKLPNIRTNLEQNTHGIWGTR